MAEIFGQIVMAGRFPAQQGLHVNYLRHWQLWYTLEGSITIRHGEQRTVTGIGEAVLVEPNFPQYGVIGEAGWTCLSFIFQARPHWETYFHWPTLSHGHHRLSPEPESRRDLEQAIAIFNGSHPQRGALAMLQLEHFFLHCLEALPQDETNSRDPRLQKAINHILESPEHWLNNEALAQSAGLSPTHLNRLFRVEVGMSPRQFQERHRLEKAHELLQYSALRVGEIAARVGFTDALYFSTRYKKQYGCSPTQTRQAERQGQTSGLTAS